MKLIFPYLECGMCSLPAPYQCDDCKACLVEEIEYAEPKKLFIGSGEDGHLYEEYMQ